MSHSTDTVTWRVEGKASLGQQPLDEQPVGHGSPAATDAHECGGCSGMTRRSVLAGVGAIGAAATLAACGGSGSGATATSADPGAGGAAPAPGVIAKSADVPVGGAFAAQLDGAPVIITQPTAGTFVGLSAVCTHQGCTVAPDGDHLACPCHGSTFDLEGAATQGPATEALVTFELSVDGDDLVAAGS